MAFRGSLDNIMIGEYIHGSLRSKWMLTKRLLNDIRKAGPKCESLADSLIEVFNTNNTKISRIVKGREISFLLMLDTLIYFKLNGNYQTVVAIFVPGL